MDYGKEFKSYATKHLGISSLRVDEYTKMVAQAPGIYGLTPNIIEERQMNAVSMDIFSREQNNWKLWIESRRRCL